MEDLLHDDSLPCLREDDTHVRLLSKPVNAEEREDNQDRVDRTVARDIGVPEAQSRTPCCGLPSFRRGKCGIAGGIAIRGIIPQ